MKLVDVTLPTAAENLALDEALLEEAEAGGGEPEVLRLWESPEFAVILGRSSRAAAEADLPTCHARNIPVLRRCSGGAAVVIGPGCLMYSVVLNYGRWPALRAIENAHQFVLERQRAALTGLVPGVLRAGISDLVLGNRKVSGNSLRCKRESLLYHGTLLYGFPLQRITDYLPSPPRQPAYREDRAHEAFVANLNVSSDALRQAIYQGWRVDGTAQQWPRSATRRLLELRYGCHDWHFKR